jgi:hypothetical protein
MTRAVHCFIDGTPNSVRSRRRTELGGSPEFGTLKLAADATRQFLSLTCRSC